jgi:hypothetical protein
MLLINQRLDKLAAARSEFVARGLLVPEQLALLCNVEPTSRAASNEEAVGGEDEAGGATDERVLADVKLARSPR